MKCLLRTTYVFRCRYRGYLTKSSPEFYDPILGHPGVQRLTRGDVWLLDDSAVNLEVRWEAV